MNFSWLFGKKNAAANVPAYNVEAPPHQNAINVRVNNAPVPNKPAAAFTGAPSSAMAPRINNAGAAVVVGGRRNSRKNSRKNRKNSRKDRKSRRSSRK